MTDDEIRDEYWPPKILWAREKGWLAVRDPVSGEWFEILAKEAPRGWARLAQQAKYGRTLH